MILKLVELRELGSSYLRDSETLQEMLRLLLNLELGFSAGGVQWGDRHEDGIQGEHLTSIDASGSLPDSVQQFSNLLGTVYCKGTLLFTPDGTSLLSPVGNRVSVFDLVK